MINFGSGPTQFPEEVLKRIQEGIMNYKNSGMSVLELPHRGEIIQNMINKTGQLVRELLELPDDYHVIWMQGGGRMQFHLLPLNFLDDQHSGAYIISGHWAKQAYLNALNQGNAQIFASSESINYAAVPAFNLDGLNHKLHHRPNYLHYCSNNTLYGTQIKHFAKHPEVALVADMSSDIFSRKLDFKQFDIIYAVNQKNIGAAGATMVIIKDSFLQKAKINLPDILSYKAVVQNNSTVNTPPVFSIFTALVRLEWMKEKGMNYFYKESEAKANLFYDFLDSSILFEGIASKESRSNTNIVFRLKNRSIHETELVKEFALKHGITGIEGHRFIGGFRIGLYQGISIEEVEKLIAVLRLYEAGV